MEIAIASGLMRTIAGRMKLHSGGTSTTLTSIARRSASSYTAMLTSVSLVAAITMNAPSRSAAPAYGRCSQWIEPSRAYSCSAGSASGAISVTARVAGEQALDLLEADLAAADDQAAPSAELQAGDVEGRVEHPLHAALVADSPAQLADALLACIGLGGHAFKGSCSGGAAAAALSAAGRGRTRARPSATARRRRRARRARGRTRARSAASRPPALRLRWSRRTGPTTARAGRAGPR